MSVNENISIFFFELEKKKDTFVKFVMKEVY